MMYQIIGAIVLLPVFAVALVIIVVAIGTVGEALWKLMKRYFEELLRDE